MLELSSLGAKVMQSSAVQTAMMYNIPLEVRSTFTDRQGTKIFDQENIDYTKNDNIDILKIIGTLQSILGLDLKDAILFKLVEQIQSHLESQIKNKTTWLNLQKKGATANKSKALINKIFPAVQVISINFELTFGCDVPFATDAAKLRNHTCKTWPPTE